MNLRPSEIPSAPALALPLSVGRRQEQKPTPRARSGDIAAAVERSGALLQLDRSDIKRYIPCGVAGVVRGPDTD